MRQYYFLLLAAVALSVMSCSNYYSYPDAALNYDSYTENGYPADNDLGGEIIPDGSGDQYAEVAENDFISTKEQNQSTFSIDADGASYAIMRAYSDRGYNIPQYSVRIEEYLNYFTFDYADPTDGNDVSINAEIGDCPWTPEHKLLRLGIKGKSLSESELPQANYVFLIDVSGSMYSDDKLPLLKKGLIELLHNLRPDDRIAIVTYSGEEKLLLQSTSVAEIGKITKAIEELKADGATSGASALKMAYNEAINNYIEGGNNRIIMGTDGDFNVGVSSDEGLLEIVEGYADKGVYLTVCGFGLGNLNDRMMEKISNAGNGTYVYIDNENEMMRVFCHERSQMVAVANDAKVQITFDAGMVESYRLIGYENRVMNNEDFEDDAKDAGEIGAGQTITALYEIVPTADWQEGSAIGNFDFRYKKMLGEGSVALGIEMSEYAGDKSENLNFAAGVAAYGMLLRKSKYSGYASFDMAKELVDNNRTFDPFGYRAELVQLIGKVSKTVSSYAQNIYGRWLVNQRTDINPVGDGTTVEVTDNNLAMKYIYQITPSEFKLFIENDRILTGRYVIHEIDNAYVLKVENLFDQEPPFNAEQTGYSVITIEKFANQQGIWSYYVLGGDEGPSHRTEYMSYLSE